MAATAQNDRPPDGEKDLVARLISAAHDSEHRLSQQEVDLLLGLRTNG